MKDTGNVALLYEAFSAKELVDLFVIIGIALRFIITSIKVLVKKIIR